MTTTHGCVPPRITVRVIPRLLGDVLAFTLRSHGFEAVVAPEQPAPAPGVTSEHVDLAVVSDGYEGEVAADVVLVLDHTGALLSVSRQAQDRRPGGDELADLLGTLIDLLPGRVVG